MSIRLINESVDVAVIGLTNSGKSTFISAFFNPKKIPERFKISDLRNNDGGLTKVTTYYNLTDCDVVEVVDVVFNINNIVRGVATTDIDVINKKLSEVPYKKFGIEKVVRGDDGTYTKSLNDNLNKLANKIKSDFVTAIKYINMNEADLLIKSIKINVPASDAVLSIMKRHKFTSVNLRDTRGFLDANLKDIEQKTPTLSDTGLDGVQACILMNGQDSVMPNLGREIYGEFVKSIFEAVPTFIIERNAKLSGKLEDYVDDRISLTSEIYNELINNPRISKLNFNEVHKFLSALGITKDDGLSANHLIDAHKRELLLPEITTLKKQTDMLDFDEYRIYEFCVIEVFDKLLGTLSNFRSLLNKVVDFFHQPEQSSAVCQEFINAFKMNYFRKIVEEYCEYSVHTYQLVRPVTEGYTKRKLLDNLIHLSLLGSRGGITTRSGGIYLYGATGVFTATLWNSLNRMIIQLNNYDDFTKAVKKYVDDESSKVLELYILEIQQCLKYVLQNRYTDIYAHFGGYPIVERDKAVDQIMNMRKLWNTTYSETYGQNAVDTVYLTEIKNYLDQIPLIVLDQIDYIRFSQLYVALQNIISDFFGIVSNSQIKTDNFESATR